MLCATLLNLYNDTSGYREYLLSVGCLALAIWIIGAGRANERLQAKLQIQQAEIERGNIARQVGSRIVQDMMAVSSTNSGIKVILEKYGFVPPSVVPPVSVKPDKQVTSAGKTKGQKSAAGK